MPEARVMEEYIEEALAVAHIWPSTGVPVSHQRGVPGHPGEVGDIDHILVYSTSLEEHVQHVRAVLSRLQQNHLYVKPEKCEFHRTTITFLAYVISRQGVKMDLTKVQAVTEWPNPTTVKELQRFLGFAKFYRRFIQNYSSVAGPLTSLLRGKPSRLAWTDQAQEAFSRAVLSQRHGIPGKLHPCAFVSNYDVGKLLSIKAALEEWRHWLEGARHPFLVLTDHRNLEYLRSAKCLNPCQARWALFFTHFQFSVTYRPGSKNSKADALSRLFEAQSKPIQLGLNGLALGQRQFESHSSCCHHSSPGPVESH
ncbi:hypothetical protein QTP86_022079 [Hemibagrus guttatus]|nr:hypothetical protein QTP86_022079 [Hemibagrus guttatus]